MTLVTLLGGPLDGREIDIPDGIREVRTRVDEQATFGAESLVEPVRTTAIYQLHTDGRWRHAGWV